MQDCIFGTHRVIDPLYSLPQPAWRLDNDMHLKDSEILIDVETLNINTVSFTQIYNECEGNQEKIADKIIKIVNSRGKLHNPVTGTGGILIGRVKRLGKSYENRHGLEIGDKIASLSSLSLTPLKIHKVKKIRINTAQVDVNAEAILFQSSPIIKIPADMPILELIAVLDEAGAPKNTWDIVKEDDTVLILGAGGKLGLLCAYAARKKLGNSGKLIGLVKTSQSYNRLRNYHLYDQIVIADALKPIQTLKEINNLSDITINCVNTPGTETLSVLSTRSRGSIFFANLASNCNVATLTAEGIGKDVNILGYKGYCEGHAEFVINLLKNNYNLSRMLSIRFESKYKAKKEDSGVGLTQYLDLNLLKNIGLDSFVFESDEIKKVLRNVIRVANYDCTVLLTGESGVGKEILAQASHKASSRSNSSMIKINCGSIPHNLLESEFFGYEGGTFTGAKSQGKIGIFEAAQGGTLFLDEIGELPLDLQVKLLRAIQEREIYRVGGIKPISIDVRLIAATNRNLKLMVEEGKFREDLFYRLNVFPIYIPPLRQRKADIIPLANNILQKYNEKFKMDKYFLPTALSCLEDYSWPGNIRELENTIQRILINSNKDAINENDIITNINYDDKSNSENHHKNRSIKSSIEETEATLLKEAKKQYKSTREMAKYLNMSQSTLVRRLKKYNIY